MNIVDKFFDLVEQADFIKIDNVPVVYWHVTDIGPDGRKLFTASIAHDGKYTKTHKAFSDTTIEKTGKLENSKILIDGSVIQFYTTSEIPVSS